MVLADWLCLTFRAREVAFEAQTSRYLNEFEELAVLGKGGYGRVYKVVFYIFVLTSYSKQHVVFEDVFIAILKCSKEISRNRVFSFIKICHLLGTWAGFKFFLTTLGDLGGVWKPFEFCSMVNFYLKMYYLKQLFMLLFFTELFCEHSHSSNIELLGVGLSVQLSEPRHSQT